MAGSGDGPRERLREVLEAVTSREFVTPGDVVVATGLPRYLVLATFQCLEALGLVEQVYSKGSYKVYTATIYARKVLELLRSGEGPVIPLLAAGPAASTAAHGAAVAAESGGEA